MLIDSHNNKQKYLSYRLALGRIGHAISEEFPIEAIAIEESIISDRLHSFVRHYSGPLDIERTSLRALVKKSLIICNTNKDEEGKQLLEIISDWIDLRNNVIHGIAKAPQNEGPPISAKQFVEFAMNVAAEGRTLTRDVLDWHKRVSRKDFAQR